MNISTTILPILNKEKKILTVFNDGSSKFEDIMQYHICQLTAGRQGSFYAPPLSSDNKVKNKSYVESGASYICTPLGIHISELFLFNKQLTTSYCMTTYGGISSHVKLPQDRIKWQISPKTKVINGHKCSMATGIYGGRNYTAWFDPTIVCDAGPWMLRGLPGLVLEAQDELGIIKYTFIDIEKVSEEELFMEFIDITKNLTQNELDRQVKAYKADPAVVYASQVNTTADRVQCIFTKDLVNFVSFNDLPIKYQRYLKQSNKIIQNPIKL